VLGNVLTEDNYNLSTSVIKYELVDSVRKCSHRG